MIQIKSTKQTQTQEHKTMNYNNNVLPLTTWLVSQTGRCFVVIMQVSTKLKSNIKLTIYESITSVASFIVSELDLYIIFNCQLHYSQE